MPDSLDITVRLTTLRALVRDAAPIVVVPLSTPLTDLASLATTPHWVVAVDDGGTLRGVLSHTGIASALVVEPDGWVTDHMTRSSIVLDAECEVADAWAAVTTGAIDHVLVVSVRSELLAVIAVDDLATRVRTALTSPAPTRSAFTR